MSKNKRGIPGLFGQGRPSTLTDLNEHPAMSKPCYLSPLAPPLPFIARMLVS